MDRYKNLRNFAIVIAIAVVVWKVPGGGTAATTISNILGIMFVAAGFFFGYRLYMEHRETLFGLEERQRGLLYGALGAGRLRAGRDDSDVERERPGRVPVARHARRVGLGAVQRLARV